MSGRQADSPAAPKEKRPLIVEQPFD